MQHRAFITFLEVSISVDYSVILYNADQREYFNDGFNDAFISLMTFHIRDDGGVRQLRRLSLYLWHQCDSIVLPSDAKVQPENRIMA